MTLFDNPFFLLVFTSDITKKKVKVVLGDTSNYRRRYNRFYFIEGTDATLTPTGYWHYKIYEQDNADNTEEVNATTLVEEGKCLVVGTQYDRARIINTRTYKTIGKGA